MASSDAGRHTRTGTRVGLFEAPPPLFEPTRSPSTSVDGDADSPNGPLYSTGMNVGQARPFEERGASALTSPLSEQPLLHGDVDYNGSDLDEGSDLGGWTPVTRKTSRTHRERSSSVGSNNTRISTASNRENHKSRSNTTQIIGLKMPF
ncbi:hypothetical protein B0H14DRAFT_3481176 [Mycena olivaceomarginata]|nr:hypothetical protein B0H14DRAFT_3481176 [Mycena olivaceomarginata]